MPPSARTPQPPSIGELLAHAPWVRRLAGSLVSGEDRADDVAQETWLAALRAPPPGGASPRGWLARVTQNVARKLVRGESRRARREAATPASDATVPSPAESFERAALQRRVVDAVMALDETYRSALLLRFFEGLAPRDVARALGVPVETARTRIRRGLALARERLRGEFAEEGRDWSAALAPLVAGKSGVAAAAGVVTGLIVGGAVMSKTTKVAVAVGVAAAALFGTYRVFRAPDDAPKVASAPRGDATPALAQPEAPPLPAPAAPETSREPIAVEAAPAKPATPDAARIEGSVVDADGRPVAGAVVILGASPGLLAFHDEWSFHHYASGLFDSPMDRSHRVASAADGSFRFDAVDRAATSVLVAAKESIGIGWGGEVRFEAGSSVAKATIRLERGVSLFGTVRDEAGRPVEGAVVWISGGPATPENAERNRHFQASDAMQRTKADGAFRTLPFAWRNVCIDVQPPEGSELMQAALPWEELPAGASEVRRDITLGRRKILRGRILGPDGAPAQLTTTVLPRLGEDAGRGQSGETMAVVALAQDPRGRKDFADDLGTNDPDHPTLDTDHVYGRILVDVDRYEIPRRNDSLRFVAVVVRRILLGCAPIPEDGTAPDVVIDPSLIPDRSRIHPLRLHLRDAVDGRPLPGVSINGDCKVRMADGGFGMHMVQFGDGQDAPADRELSLPLVPVSLLIHKQGYVHCAVDVDASRPDAPTELTVELRRAFGALVLHVTDESGKPVAGAQARLFGVDGKRRIPLYVGNPSDEHGVLKVDDLPAGEGLAIVSKPDFAPAVANFAIDAKEESADVTLEPGIEMPLEIRRPDGHAATVAIYSIADEEGIPVYESGAGFSLGWGWLKDAKLRLVDGTYTITARIPGECEGSATFVASPGAKIVVEMKPTGR